MQALRSSIPRRWAAFLGVIMCILVMVPLVLITEPPWEQQLSPSKMVSMLVGGSAQEAVNENPSVAEGAIVFMEYTITIPESDLTIPDNLTFFEHGHQDVLPNIEKAITGMKRGEEKRIDLTSEEAFGPYDESKRVEMRRDRLPVDVQPGMILITEEGVPFVVVDLIGSMAEIDFNHPLAGRHVVFDVRILNVEIPWEEVPLDSEQNLQRDDDVVSRPRIDFDPYFTQRRSHGPL